MPDVTNRKRGGGRSYPIPVWSGIFDHKRNIGSAIWVFLWCLDRITRDESGIGQVLGGTVVASGRIAGELHESERTVRRHLERLAKHGNILLKRKPLGFVITVPNSRKFNIWRPHKNGHPDRTKMPVASGKNADQLATIVRSNKDDSAVDAAERQILPPYPPSGGLTPRQRRELGKELDRIYKASVGCCKGPVFEEQAIRRACEILVLPLSQAKRAIADSEGAAELEPPDPITA